MAHRTTSPKKSARASRTAARTRAGVSATTSRRRTARRSSTRAPFVPVKRVSVVRKPSRGPRMPASPPAPSVAPGVEQQTVAGPMPPAQAPGRLLPAERRASGSGEADAPSVEAQFSIPTGYGDDHIVLMIKDPWWLYAYWEIQAETERVARRELLPHEAAGLQSVLRVHDVTGIEFPAKPAHRSFDISLSGLANNWFIHTDAPNRSFIVELGLLANTGRFLLLARSNRVTTPRCGPSEVIDEAWAVTDEAFWTLSGAASGIGVGSSPTAWAGLWPQPSSSWHRPPVSSGTRQAVQGFWCRVNTDVVIHGAAEPKSAVTIQGQPASVRKDGTFSLRLTLPEGTQTLAIEVTSADTQETRSFNQALTLETSGPLATEAPASPPSGTPHPLTPPGRRRRGA